ncbi:phosphate-starvation-inducible PsiE family protein [Kiritimatiellota bacterium B12222]|nr:phosphate-starvation-inducible PsiE family protein [Kiritimatiellota bacterium B12222]
MNSSPPLKGTLKVIRAFETGIIIFLVVLMMIVVSLSAFELAVMLWKQVIQPPYLLLNLEELLEVLGFFMMVLIGLELLETIKNYLTQHALHVEVVILVAMIAISRKVIILDMKETTWESMSGIAFLLLSLAVSYFLIKKGMQFPTVRESSE